MRLEGLGQLKKISSDLIGNGTRDLPACSIVPQLTTLLRAPTLLVNTLEKQINHDMNNENAMSVELEHTLWQMG
jgi:hypothetical protein